MAQRGFLFDGSAPPVLTGPARVEAAIVFEVGDAKAARAAMEAFTQKTSGGGAIAEVLRYVARRSENGATLTALYPERTQDKWKGPNWELAVPAAGPGGLLSGTHHLQLGDSSDGKGLLAGLVADRDVTFAHHPVVQYPLDAPPGGLREFVMLVVFRFFHVLGKLAGVARLASLDAEEEKQWWLKRCGFPAIWDVLDQGHVPGAIAVIDQGGDTDHRELRGRIVTKQVPMGSAPSKSIHASAVAGVISASRVPRIGISGCCSATLHLYNVWTSDDGFDSLGYYNALKDVACSGVRVLNVSLGSTLDDEMVRRLVAECVKKRVIVVAAAGNDTGKPVFPAAYPDVIAVGATSSNPSDAKTDWSAEGDIAAPGEFILTTYGSKKNNFLSGTSFSAPMVTSAVWLALRKKPGWGLAELMKLLEESVAGNGPGTRDLGFGRLDMVALRKALGI